jgi:predicted kinase
VSDRDEGGARAAGPDRTAADPPPVFLVVGPPGVGKSTASRALAERFARSVHIPVDDLRHMVVHGLALPAVAWSDELVRQIALARGVAIRMAEDHAAAGFAVVIDDFPDPMLLAEYAGFATRPRTHRILLLPPQEVALRRNRARSGDGPEGDYIEDALPIAYAIVEPHADRLRAEGWVVLDTGDLAVDETVDALLRLTGEGPGATDPHRTGRG